MSLIYEEFESNMPPSMSDEELKQKIKEYKLNATNKRTNQQRIEERQILAVTDKKNIEN